MTTTLRSGLIVEERPVGESRLYGSHYRASDGVEAAAFAAVNVHRPAFGPAFQDAPTTHELAWKTNYTNLYNEWSQDQVTISRLTERVAELEGTLERLNTPLDDSSV
jgi:hypothetical protein